MYPVRFDQTDSVDEFSSNLLVNARKLDMHLSSSRSFCAFVMPSQILVMKSSGLLKVSCVV